METELTRPLRDDEEPSRTRRRFDSVFGVFKAYESRIGPVHGADAVEARRLAASTLTLAFFVAAAGDDAEHAINSLASSIESIG